MADNIGSMSVQITGSTTGLSAALKTANSDIKSFQSKVKKYDWGLTTDHTNEFKKLGRPNSGFLGNLREMAKGIVGIGASGVSGLGSILSGTMKAATSLPAIGVGAVGALGLGAFVAESIKMAATVEDTQTTFRVMLGDINKAKSLYADIRKFAASTPMTTGESTETASLLLGGGVDQSQVIPTMRVLGDVASGAGQQLKDVAIIYNQVRSKGKLYAEELMQFNERNIPMQEELARVMGVSGAQLHTLISEGKVGFPDLQRALIAMTSEGGKFFGMMEARSKTFNGVMSTLKDSAENFMGTFGQAFIEEFGLKDAAKTLSNLFDEGESGIDRLRPMMRDVKSALVTGGQAFYQLMFRSALVLAKVVDSLPSFSIKKQTEDAFGLKTSLYLDMLTGGSSGAKTGPAEQLLIDLDRGFKKISNQADELSKPNNAVMSGLRMTPLEWKRGQPGFGEKAMERLLIEQRKLTAEQIKTAQSIREAMNPREGFKRSLAEIQDIFKLGGFRKNDGPNEPGWMKGLRDQDAVKTRNFAVMQAFDDLTKGIVGGPKLGGMALRGSVEDASLINNHRVGGSGADDIPGILKQQKQIMEQLQRRADEIAKALEKAGLLVEVK